jgi:ribosomal protein S18 acetylase RimI-like enzyme
VVRAVELKQMVQETEAPEASAASGTTPEVGDPKIGDSKIVNLKIGDSKIVDLQIVELTPSDVAEMSVVYAATRPGRTLCPKIQKLGTFLGVREQGKLAAMAGLRLHIAGYREITTVATLPEFEGRGYATALVRALVERIRGRGERPFLTVRTDNDRAVEIYRRLGFAERTRFYSQTIRRGS